ncbi:MAG TPA: hypothetical protein PKM40_09090, partial [Bacteroidia bacterium]|nr:hypothetical protein [Bacteroidia bacterium]
LVWSNGFEKKQRIEFPPIDADVFKLDGEGLLPDLQRRNNVIYSKGMNKKRRALDFHLLTSIENEEKINLNYLPIAGANFYNGFMLGAALHNFSLYRKPFEFYLAPLYAFNSKTLSGFAELAFNFFPKQVFSSISAGFKAKSFAYDYFNPDTYNNTYSTSLKPLYANYYKLNPFVEFDFKRRPANSKLNHSVLINSTFLFTDSLFYQTTGNGPEVRNKTSYMNGIKYVLSNTRLLSPYEIIAGIQQTGTMIKSSVVYTQKVSFTPRYVGEIRIFAGTFLSGDAEKKSYYALRAGGYTGYQDVLFDQNFIARNERNGLGFSQFSEEDGALKVWTPLGQSNTWLGAVNLKSPKLYKLPIKVYGDVVFTDAQFLNKDAFLWNAGLNLSILNSVIEVYFPLFYSKDIQDALELNQVTGAQRIRFTLNIHNFSPGKILQSLLKQ